METLSERQRMRSRRTTTTSLPTSVNDVDDDDVYEQQQRQERRQRRRRRTRQEQGLIGRIFKVIQNTPMLPQLLLCWIIGILVICGYVLRLLLLNSSSHKMRLVERYSMLYNETYTIATERRQPPDQAIWPAYEKYSYTIESSYGSNINKCSMTFIVMEAKLSYPIYQYGPGQSLWFGLESIGAFAPSDSCVVLITSTCAMKEYLGSTKDDKSVEKEIIHTIYEQSLPLFRRMIESGRVRITFMDQPKIQKYHLTSCTEFSSSNNALFHHQFWEDEFVEQDSDTVVVFEAENSALCYPLVSDHNMIQDYAYIGSVSPKTSNPFIPDSLEGPCREMPKSWHTWLRPQRKYQQNYQERTTTNNNILLQRGIS